MTRTSPEERETVVAVCNGPCAKILLRGQLFTLRAMVEISASQVSQHLMVSVSSDELMRQVTQAS
jgi:hypothetical protein